MAETHVIGPPGTGKTTWLSRQVERAAEKYGADQVMVCSFTRAAVTELNRRELPIPSTQVGTLHSLAYHALSSPKIVETGKYLRQFSDEYPHLAIDDATRGDIEDGYTQGGKTEGAKLLQEYSRLRALMRPRELWPDKVNHFAQLWDGFKDEICGMDFTDLIDICLREHMVPNFEAAVGLFDEAQDFTPLETSLVRQWGENMENLVMVGDGDQTLYHFKGASSDLGLRPNTHLITLKQSYRVSRSIYEFSEKVINLIPKEERLQREYLPTEEDGQVVDLLNNYNSPEMWWDQVAPHLEDYQTVMILASCSYMLDSIIRFLRRHAIPYSNSYRRRRRDWNPLYHSSRVITAATRVKDYLAGWQRDPVTWTGSEINHWLALVSGVVKRGGKDKLAGVMSEKFVPSDLLNEVLPIEQMMAHGPEWILDHLSAAHRRSEYQIRVGLQDIIDVEAEPALCVGTIHSVKGGEADCVVIFPDLSPEAVKAVRYGDIGPTTRMFFVGATRARSTLYLGQPVNPGFAIRWPE